MQSLAYLALLKTITLSWQVCIDVREVVHQKLDKVVLSVLIIWMAAENLLHVESHIGNGASKELGFFRHTITADTGLGRLWSNCRAASNSASDGGGSLNVDHI